MGQHGKANVYNSKKLNRKVLFKGCEHGYNTYPTDFDAVFNIRNEVNIIIDAKEKGKKPVFGQTITYINMSKAIEKGGVPAYVIWVEHSPNDKEITLAECIVSLIWRKGKWITKKEIYNIYQREMSYKELQSFLLKKHNVEEYNPNKHKFNKHEYLP